MFDKLYEGIIQFLEYFYLFNFVKPYEMGMHYRKGKFLRVVEPGMWWRWPIIDLIEVHTVTTTTLSIPTQSLTTADDKQIVVKSMVKYKIADIKSFYLNINDPVDAISDTTQAIIKEQIINKTWNECRDNNLDNEITKKLRTQVRKWGFDVECVTITDLGLIRSYRLFNEAIKND